MTGSAAALDAAQTHITELDQTLAISVAAASTLQEQVRLAQQGEQQLQRALETARHDFACELDKLRADGALALERLKAAETRARREIDRERQAAARLQKALDAAARKREQGDTRYRTELQALHVQLGDLRQQVGVLEGNLASVQVAHARDADELARTRKQLAMSRASANTRRQTPPKPVVKRKMPRTPRS